MNTNTFEMYSNTNTLHFSQKYSNTNTFKKCIRILMYTNTFCPGLVKSLGYTGFTSIMPLPNTLSCE